MSALNTAVGTCGFFCCPARWPATGQAEDQRDCAHRREVHYNIDGENVGCSDCEDEDMDNEYPPGEFLE